MMAKFNQEFGAPAMQRFILSLRGMPEAFSKMGLDPKKAMTGLIADIKELTKGGDQAGLRSGVE